MNDRYRIAVETRKKAILRSQDRDSGHMNAEMHFLYYTTGCYAFDNSRKVTWGIKRHRRKKIGDRKRNSPASEFFP